MSTLAFRSPLEEANRLFNDGQYAPAAQAFRQAAEDDSNNAYAWKGLGLSLAHLDQMDEAMSACHRAVDLMPGNADLHYALGYVCVQGKRFPEAIAELDKALILQPMHEDAKKSLVYSLLHEAEMLLDLDPPRAAIMLERAHRYEPRNPHTVAPFLEALYRTNQRGKAAQLIAETPDWIKSHERVQPVLSRIRANPQFSDVIQRFEDAERQNVARPVLISPVMHHTTDKMPCPNCMMQIPFHDEFCAFCGVKVRLGP